MVPSVSEGKLFFQLVASSPVGYYTHLLNRSRFFYFFCSCEKVSQKASLSKNEPVASRAHRSCLQAESAKCFHRKAPLFKKRQPFPFGRACDSSLFPGSSHAAPCARSLFSEGSYGTLVQREIKRDIELDMGLG